MRTVIVRDASGNEHTLAFVERKGNVVFVCSVDRRLSTDDDEALMDFSVGFPVEDVREPPPSAQPRAAN